MTIWPLINWGRLADLYRSGEIFENARIKQLWSIYSLALICSGQWLTPAECQTTRVDVDPALYQTNWSKARWSIVRKLDRVTVRFPFYRSKAITRQMLAVRRGLEIDDESWTTFLDSLGLMVSDGLVVDKSGREVDPTEICQRCRPKLLVADTAVLVDKYN